MENPIPELIPDNIYEVLKENHLLNETSIRNYKIRKRYHKLRDDGLKSGDAVEVIHKDYPYIAFDSVSKICRSSRK